MTSFRPAVRAGAQALPLYSRYERTRSIKGNLSVKTVRQVAIDGTSACVKSQTTWPGTVLVMLSPGKSGRIEDELTVLRPKNARPTLKVSVAAQLNAAGNMNQGG